MSTHGRSGTQEQVNAKLASFGIGRGMFEVGDQRVHRFQLVCGDCGKTELKGWPVDIDPNGAVANARRQGWTLRRGHDPLCSACSTPRRDDPMTKTPAIGPDPKIARKVFALLDEHFDEHTRLYRDGYTDKRIADEVGTSEELVARTRSAAYGELAEDPVISGLRDDVQLLRMELDDLMAGQAKLADAMRLKIDAVEEKLTRAKIVHHKAAG